MANGKMRFGKQSGGTLGLVFPDGVSDTEVVLPESGNIASVGTAVTDNAIARYDGTTGKLQNSRVIVDDTGSLLLTSGTGALGYGAGAGGTVTQLTNKNTAVALNKPCGTITMSNSTIPAGGYVVFNFYCDLLTAFDSIKVQIVAGYSTYEAYTLSSDMSNGSMVRVVVKNTTAASLSEALILQYTIIKGSNF